jgi:hypothetical protein
MASFSQRHNPWHNQAYITRGITKRITRGITKLEKNSYDKLLHDNITSAYKKASSEAYNKINQEAKVLASTLKIGDRTECMAKRQAFITLYKRS